MAPIVRNLFVCLALATPLKDATGGSVYKWIDADGNVHFGDRPTTDSAKEVPLKENPTVSQPSTSAPDRRQPGVSISDVMEEERLRRKQAREKERAAREDRRRNCVLARDRLRSYQEAGYLYDIDSGGNRRPLSNSERADAEARARAEVQRWCS